MTAALGTLGQRVLIGARLPERAAVIVELCVAGMLRVLGARAIAGARGAAAASNSRTSDHTPGHTAAPTLWCERSSSGRSLWA